MSQTPEDVVFGNYIHTRNIKYKKVKLEKSIDSLCYFFSFSQVAFFNALLYLLIETKFFKKQVQSTL